MNITITNTIQKTTQSGQHYMLIESNMGKFGCWEEELFEILKNGNTINAEVSVKGEYRNIVRANLMNKTHSTPDKERLASVCVSYSKDLVIANKIDLSNMEEWAIKFADIINTVKEKL